MEMSPHATAGIAGRRTGRNHEEPEEGAARLYAKAAGSEFASLGIAMGLAIALLAVGGNWLDGRLGTAPLFVLLGVLLGVRGELLQPVRPAGGPARGVGGR